MKKPNRGDIFRAELDPATGHEIQKTRPVLIVSNDIFNKVSPLLIVAPITSGRYRYLHRVHIEAPEGGLSKPSNIAVEQIRAIDKSRLHSYMGTISEATLEQVESTIKDLLGLPEGNILT